MSRQENWLRGRVIGMSVSESEDLLSYGFGPEHLREFLIRLAQRLVRAGADLAYGGHFSRRGSFTRDLIELISDEQREGIGDQRPWLGSFGTRFRRAREARRARAAAEREADVDAVLDKVHREGVNALTAAERKILELSLIHISEPTRLDARSRMPSSA